MICPQCGAPAVAGQQRFCQKCGAMLMPAPAVTPVQVVGDGSERAMKTLKQQAALDWLNENKGRLILWGVGGMFAIAVISAAIITVISALVVVIGAVLPLLMVLLIIAAVAPGPRRRRRYRRWMGPY